MSTIVWHTRQPLGVLLLRFLWFLPAPLCTISGQVIIKLPSLIFTRLYGRSEFTLSTAGVIIDILVIFCGVNGHFDKAKMLNIVTSKVRVKEKPISGGKRQN